MKKILLILFVVIPLSSKAQVCVTDVQTQADTLMLTFSSGMDMINVYKNTSGYYVEGNSSNPLDYKQAFYLGRDEHQVVESIGAIMPLFDEDVATTASIIDAEGKTFFVITDLGVGGANRKKTFQKSTMIRVKSKEMAGYFHLRKKALEELLVYFGK